jgi:hypothetical protein
MTTVPPLRSDTVKYVPYRLRRFNAISLRQFEGIRTGVQGKKDPANLSRVMAILKKFGMPHKDITERLIHILIDRIASNPDALLILPKDINTDLIYFLKKLQHQKIQKIEISVEAHYKNVESESGLHILNLETIHVPTIVHALTENQAILLVETLPKENKAVLLNEPVLRKHTHHRTAVSHDCNGSAQLPHRNDSLYTLMAKITSGMINATNTILSTDVELPIVRSAMSDYLSELHANSGVKFERYVQKVMDQLIEKGIDEKRYSEIALQMINAYKEYFLPNSEVEVKFFWRLSKGPYSVLGGEKIGPDAAARRLMEAPEVPTINIRWYTGSFNMNERSRLGRSMYGYPPFNESLPASAGGAKKSLEGSLATNIGRGSRFFQTFGITSYQKIFAKELNETRQDIFAQITDIRKRLVYNKPFNQIYEELLKLSKIEVSLINDVEQIIKKIKQSGQMGQGIPEELRDILAPQNVPVSPAKDLDDAKAILQKSLGINALRLIRFLQTFGSSTYEPGFARTLYDARLKVLSDIAGVRNVLILDKTFSNQTYAGLLEMNRIEIDLISELEQIMEKMKGGGQIGQVVPEELRDILAPQLAQVKQMPANAPVDKQPVQRTSMKVDVRYIYRVKGTPVIYNGTKVPALLDTGALHLEQLEPVGEVVDVTTGLVGQHLTENEAKEAGLELWQLQWTSEGSH